MIFFFCLMNGTSALVARMITLYAIGQIDYEHDKHLK